MTLPNLATGPMPMPSVFPPSPKPVRSTEGPQEVMARMGPSAKIPSKSATPCRFFIVLPLLVAIFFQCHYSIETPAPFVLVPFRRGWYDTPHVRAPERVRQPARLFRPAARILLRDPAGADRLD